MTNLEIEITLEAQTCGECGIVFGIEAKHRQMLIETHGTFYCPNGHCRCFVGKSAAEKLRDELTRKTAALDQAWADISYKNRLLESERRSTAAVKGVLTKVKKRIAGGVCPCCHRYFPALHRHMTTQHPAEKAVADAK